MIMSFANDQTRRLYEGLPVEGFPPDILERAVQKLQILNAANRFHDLEVALGAKLDVLTGERDGKHCLKVLNKGRLCFFWKESGAHEVEVFLSH
ncbi:MAG: hypothetical protein EON93_16820 [Burkholderiales bacterium]|nr:MAG: hypothetical protein EON93_16820 [Burkholderiales bacterium]